MRRKLISFLTAASMLCALFVLPTTASAAAHTHKICGEAGCTDGAHTDITWTEWTKKKSLPTKAGNYYLSVDVTLSGAWKPASNTNLCMNGHVIKRSSGCIIRVLDGRTLTLTDCAKTPHKFSYNEKNHLWTLDEASGTKTLYGGVITGAKNMSEAVSSAVTIGTLDGDGGAVFNMYNINIAANRSNYKYTSDGETWYDGTGGGVSNYPYNTFIMNSGSVSNNSSSSRDGGSGGGVWNCGTFIMNGGSISNNQAFCTDDGLIGGCRGGGVYNAGTFILNSGSVSGNTAHDYGGGVFNFGTLTMTGGSVSGNTVALESFSEFFGRGGGVYNAGTLTMTGGSVSDNTAYLYGGGVFNFSTFTMNGGSVSKNRTRKIVSGDGGGGGVYNDIDNVFHDVTFTMNGGSVSGNTAAARGGGVYNRSIFNMNGGSVFDNRLGGVYISSESTSVSMSGTPVIKDNHDYNFFINSEPIKISDALTDGAQIGVTTADAPAPGVPVNITGENSADYSKYFTSDLGLRVINGEKNVVQLGLHEHDVSAECGNDSPIVFTPWTKTDELPPDAGSYALATDVTLTGAWAVPTGMTNLCLNGHTITYTGSESSIISIGTGATLNLCDCDKSAAHYGSWSSDGTAYTISPSQTDGAAKLIGGIITGGGTAVYINGDASSGARFHMYGGNIAGNSSLTGTVYIGEYGEVNLYNGNIADNKSSNRGGGVNNNGAFHMSGGTITRNSAHIDGGGVSSGKSFTITGGSITDNTANRNGGGVYFENTLNLSGSASVVNNTNSDSGDLSNIYIGSGSKITMNGALENTEKIGVTADGIFTDGWQTNMSGKNPSDYFVSDDTDRSAGLSGNEAAIGGYVTYNSGGAGGTVPTDDTLYLSADTITPLTNTLAKAGYTAAGWSDDTSVNTALTTLKGGKNITLYPVFARNFEDTGKSAEINLIVNQAMEELNLNDYLKFSEGVTNTSKSFVFELADEANNELPLGLSFNDGKISGAPTAKGETTVKFTVTDTSPFVTLMAANALSPSPASETGALTLTFKVTSLKETGSGSVTMADYHCGDTSAAPVPVSATNGTDNVTYQYKTKNADDSEYTNDKPLTAGEYTVKASFAENEDYTSASATADFTVSHAETDWTSDADKHRHVCPGCGDAYDEEPHTRDNGTIEGGSCSKGGTKIYKCTVCGAVMGSENTPPQPHTAVTDAAISPSCTAAGKTEGSHCSVCGTVITAQEEIPALGHDYKYSAEKNLMTETCPRCGHSESAVINVINNTASVKYSDGWVGEKPDIIYSMNGQTVVNTTAPGKYTASVTIGVSVASVEFEVNKKTHSGGGSPIKPTTPEPAKSPAPTDEPTSTDEPTPTDESTPTDKPSPAPTQTPAPASANNFPFADVSEADWFYSAVKTAYKNGLMSGVSNMLFEPDMPLTRGMAATVIGRMEKAEAGDGKTAYPDVDENMYYAPYIAWGTECGILDGFHNGMFYPDEFITREQMAKIIKRYYDYKGYTIYTADIAYSDEDLISEWARDSVEHCSASGIMTGRHNNTFAPIANITRAEFASVITRLAKIE